MTVGQSSYLLVMVLALAVTSPPVCGENQPAELVFRARRCVETGQGSGRFKVTEETVRWKPQQTAVVICDMWDQHWCRSATARVAEMAPRMNELITALRQRGVLIIHCPSDTMKFYENHAGRKLAKNAPKVETEMPFRGWYRLDPQHEAPLPIDDSDSGCDDEPRCSTGNPWRHQIDTIQVADGDAITDNVETYYLMRERGVTNMLIMGVHENMCILARPFAIRQMILHGQNVVLVRDLTDTMYNPRRKPLVDHFAGTDLVTWHIEKYWCPTTTSDKFLGGAPFRFAADTKPPRVFKDDVNELKTGQ